MRKTTLLHYVWYLNSLQTIPLDISIPFCLTHLVKATVGKGCIKSCACNEKAPASIVEFVWALAGSTLGKVTQCLAFDYLIVRIHVPLECPPLTPLPLQFPPLGSARRRPLIGREPSHVTGLSANQGRVRAGRRVSGHLPFWLANPSTTIQVLGY